MQITIIYKGTQVTSKEHSTWGRWVVAIGGNAHAAKLSGIPVERIIVSVYVMCSLCAGLAAFLMVGWFGSVTNALGLTYELNVIAASDALPYSDGDNIRARLSRQVYSPVRWVDTINAMHSAGASAVIECGPGKVLAGLMRRINKTMQRK